MSADAELVDKLCSFLFLPADKRDGGVCEAINIDGLRVGQ